jgi:hypothetical protein
MIDHVTYHVVPGTLERIDLKSFMLALGLEEIEAAESVPEGWRVRWFARPDYLPGNQTVLHLVETPRSAQIPNAGNGDKLGLGHFCVTGVGLDRYNGFKATRWLDRDSGSGRIWLRFANLRVEVRP